MISLVFAIVALTQYAQAICKEGCHEPISIYEDIGCKPIYDTPGDCCPTKFDCDHLTKKPNGTCLLQGVSYEVRKSVPGDLTYPACQASCQCIDSDGPNFVCAQVECPELFTGPLPAKSECRRTYELDKCCSVGKICPPFDSLAKCKVKDKIFYEGEKFYPDEKSCTECVCQKGFKGEFVEPFCQTIKCLAQLRHSKAIENNCAVVYAGSGKCCPYTFNCPEESDKIVKTSRAIEGGPTCKYGAKELNVGDSFEKANVINEYDTEVTKCKCSVPPMVACTYEHVINKDKVPAYLKQYYQ